MSTSEEHKDDLEVQGKLESKEGTNQWLESEISKFSICDDKLSTQEEYTSYVREHLEETSQGSPVNDRTSAD